MQRAGIRSRVYPLAHTSHYAPLHSTMDDMNPGGTEYGGMGQFSALQAPEQAGYPEQASIDDMLAFIISSPFPGAVAAPPSGNHTVNDASGGSISNDEGTTHTFAAPTPSTLSDAAQSPITRAPPSAPSLTLNTNGHSPSLNPVTPSFTVHTFERSVEMNRGAMHYHDPAVQQIVEEAANVLMHRYEASLAALRRSTSAHPLTSHNTNSGGRFAPYRTPQAVARSADLSATNVVSTGAALAGGAQSDDVGGTTSARYRAAQVVTAPTIVPSHTHATSRSANAPRRKRTGSKCTGSKRTGRWKNAEEEKRWTVISSISMDKMAFGDNANSHECSFVPSTVHEDGSITVSAPCGMTFDDNTQRNRHAQEVHLNSLAETCKYCSMTLSRGDALLRHIQEAGCRTVKKWLRDYGEVRVRARLQRDGYQYYGPKPKKAKA
ncbi:unnamed protein product [Peniophora sp. CBMAI 1063]|nr:unnamed protein product [Peniophora sp. CBMAI 1063]